MASLLSQILVFGVLVFLAVGSGVLAWDGFALALGRGRATGRDLRLARARLAVGLLGVALAAWLAIGFVTRVH